MYDVDEIELKAKDAVLVAGSTNETYFKNIDSNHTHMQRDQQAVEHEITVSYDAITDIDGYLKPSEAEDKVIYMGATGSATWNFSVPSDGFYNIQLDYVPVNKLQALENT